MSKGNKRTFEELSRVDDMLAKLHMEKQKIAVECSHQVYKKGKNEWRLKLDFLDDRGTAECKICHVKFNIHPISQNEVLDAVETLHNVVQQVRAFSNPDKDAKTIRDLGLLDYNNQRLPEIYRRTLDTYSNRKKQKNNNKNNGGGWGSYGTQNLSFMGGGGGGKRR